MGLGLEQFLNHGQVDRGKRKFLGNWKAAGSIVVWIHTKGSIAWPAWVHPFIVRGVYEDRESGKEVECLRYPRFVSPDPEPVNKSQYFREADDRLKVKPLHDPFLKLREWLRHDCDYSLDRVIFKWEIPNPKIGQVPIIEWTRGELAKLVDKTKTNFAHTLDSKLIYYFVVVDDANPRDGAQIVSCTKLLGELMRDEIKRQISSNGAVEGNPLVTPYAFMWEFNKNEIPMKMYNAYKYNQAKLTTDVREAVTSDEYPNPGVDCEPKAGDKARIRAAFEDAAQVDLPWDLLFPDSWIDEEGGSFDYGNNVEVKKEVVPSISRRKKVEKIPCDDCGNNMFITDTRCKKCGAEYEVDVDSKEVSSVDKDNKASEDSSAVIENKPVSKKVSKVDKKAEENLEEDTDKCWSCGGTIEDDCCNKCGLDVSDNVPF